MLLPVLAVAALPFRIPVQAGGQSALLLVPLYVVVGGGAWRTCGSGCAARRGGRTDNGYRVAPAERDRACVELALLVAVALYSVQAPTPRDFETALKNVAFFYIPFALLLKLLSSCEWTARLDGLVLARARGARRCCSPRSASCEYARAPAALNPKVIESNQFSRTSG